MTDNDLLARQFEEHRAHLSAVAYRMLGSRTEADDAVQEAWLRLSRSGIDDVANLGGWLTTVVSRVCLNMLRSRQSRREDPLDTDVAESFERPTEVADPEQEAVLADSVGSALLVVLETLAPAERLAFVLHDMFGVPFEEIASIVGRSPAAARQLASRARRRVQGASASGAPDRNRQREIVAAFLAASRGGDFAALVAALDPEVVLRADAAAVDAGAPPELRGAHAVAEQFSGRARAARLALIDGVPGAVWSAGGRPRVVFEFSLSERKIVGIDLVADPVRLEQLELVALPTRQ